MIGFPATPRAKSAPRQEALTHDQFAIFRNFLYQVSGVYVPEQQKHILDSRVLRRMEAVGAASPSEYYVLLHTAPKGDPASEFFLFLDALTTHETNFFRHEQQFAVLQHAILPELMARQRKQGHCSLKMWSAACSSGEEAYTLAMVAREAFGTEVDRWNLNVLGTDLSPAVIHKAQQATYGEYSLRGVPSYYFHKYFTRLQQNAGLWQVRPEVRSQTHFKVLNFCDDPSMGALGGLHVIFCRNAFIYFDAEARRRFTAHFYDALVEGGYLVLGHSETLYGIENRFSVVQHPQAVVYRKGDPSGDKPSPW